MKAARPPSWQILLAFAIIYFVWGSTFLAIRVGLREVPPFLLAAMRFFAAGLILYVWMRLKGSPSPSLREWAGASFLGRVFFLVHAGGLCVAEQRVPSGIAAVILATIRVFITLSEITFLRTQRLTLRLATALVVGICGVAVLMSHSASLGEVPVNRVGAAALLIAAVTWSIATILTKRIPLPASKPMSAAAQMLTGGVQLFVVAAFFGEMRGFHFDSVSTAAWFSLIYLIFAGSIAGFTAYIWLLHYESPTKVGTYAYVKSAVAVASVYFLGGEAAGTRPLVGTLLVLVSLVPITATAAKRKPETETRPVEVGEVA